MIDPTMLERARAGVVPLLMSVAVVFSAQRVMAQAPAPAPSNSARAADEKARAPFSHALPRLDGAHLTATVVEVTYPPGGSSKPHSHPCPVIGYIIEGALRTQVKGEPEVVYTAGQSFYEAPNGAHVVSANASADKPVRFLAYFTCDRQGPLLTPLPDSAASPRR